MSEIQVLKGAEEFAFGEGPVGALLIHGFTGSPQGMRGLGEYLAERGIAVAAPRLPGHGTTWEDLNTRTGEEWAQTVETSFHHLASQTEEVFVVGLSFGAALALDLAARHQEEIAGVITLAGMVFTKDPRRFLAPVIARLSSSIPGVGNDIADPEGKEIAYDRVPTKGALAMLRFIKRAHRAVPQIKTPILVMHAHQDHTVHPSNAQYIHDNIGSTDKQLVWFERSYHVITLDVEREQVFENTYNFIKERAKNAV
ncbi:MAG: carboxylesterase [Actinomycetota bacterium]|nr:carboxylesterase [Actinomycetota bacterium]